MEFKFYNNILKTLFFIILKFYNNKILKDVSIRHKIYYLKIYESMFVFYIFMVIH
jgi:hypothetical protein